MISDFDDTGEEPPEDVGDESQYLAVPSKNELDLGRTLALRFVEEQLPESYERAKSFFAKAGAYARFKQLLEDAGRLQSWYTYEAQGTREALLEWAAENGIEVTEQSGGAR